METAIVPETAAATTTTDVTETISAYEFPEGQIAYDITCSDTSPSFRGNADDDSILIEIDGTHDGVLTIVLDEEIIKPFDDGTFFVLINGESRFDFTQVGNKLTVMILVVAIVSIIIVSAKTKLSLVPRY